jgi:hypothetical protein
MTSSVPGLLYASTWADAHGHFFTTDARLVLRAQSLLTLLGLLPTALVLLGLARILRRPRRHAAWFGPGVFAAAILVSLLGYSWSLPYYSAVKASYLLPAALPAAYALCVGLGALPRRALGLLRLALLLLAAVATGLTWYGWWL